MLFIVCGGYGWNSLRFQYFHKLNLRQNNECIRPLQQTIKI